MNFYDAFSFFSTYIKYSYIEDMNINIVTNVFFYQCIKLIITTHSYWVKDFFMLLNTYTCEASS